MQADAVALAVGKQGDGANIIRQRQRAEDTGPTRRGNALQRGGKMISMQINNSALRRGRDTFKFGQRAAGGRILMWEHRQLGAVHGFATQRHLHHRLIKRDGAIHIGDRNFKPVNHVVHTSSCSLVSSEAVYGRAPDSILSAGFVAGKKIPAARAGIALSQLNRITAE